MAQEPTDCQPLEGLALNCDIEDDVDSSTLESAAESNSQPENLTATCADGNCKSDLEEPELFMPHSCAHCQKIMVKWPIDGNSSRVQRLPYSNKQAYRAWKDGCRLYGFLLELSKKPDSYYLLDNEEESFRVAHSTQEFIEKMVAQIEPNMRRGVLELVRRLQRPFSLVCFTRPGGPIDAPRLQFRGRLGRSQSHNFYHYAEAGNFSEIHYVTVLIAYSKSWCAPFPRQTLQQKCWLQDCLRISPQVVR
jgi:hypothetical protein